jgi:hypothetical protein
MAQKFDNRDLAGTIFHSVNLEKAVIRNPTSPD